MSIEGRLDPSGLRRFLVSKKWEHMHLGFDKSPSLYLQFKPVAHPTLPQSLQCPSAFLAILVLLASYFVLLEAKLLEVVALNYTSDLGLPMPVTHV